MVTRSTDESALIAALQAGDQNAFALLVDEHTPTLLRAARGYVATHAIAEEVVQDTWIALVRGVSKFEGRSSLRTWLFAVMTNIAKTRGLRERRDRDAAASFMEATVDPARFHARGDTHAGSWKEPPTAFPDSPEGSVLSRELRSIAHRELDRLPERQRIVVTLRDMLGFDSAEVCELLDITAGNQRILLHRGRAAIRQVLEDYVRDDSPVPTDP
ncbi:RNA polymerase, sigma-24 subunit, ECF subfamily [uncultured Mycobacterium sp.]|uniref:RNA polymerase, sigma-24 subunit, ECF subfamily n=1 Tax=uncultured Mycobacterium sp. TaxID=171292 RepID=A0A1Y5PFM9_9MYCO|nr:RNA polymerase, sigma-24 subunit, ECF subfamily [uncultured Mycobacterium sp.]SBS76486.1 RNA polymerase, sigma-24 subunit, ECF subfamily [uncultured Mycobacterium sp.]